MTMTRRTRRIMTVSASVVALTVLPGFSGVASAHGTDPGSGSCSENTSGTTTRDRSTVLTDAQAAAVDNARTAYFAATAAARATLKAAVDAAWASVKAETSAQRDAAQAADNAYRAAKDSGADTTALKAAAEAAESTYRSALAATVAKYQAPVATARAAQSTALDAAAAAYTKAITDAFAGQSVPKGLLDLPRSHGRHDHAANVDGFMGHGHGNGHGMSDQFGTGHDRRDFGRSGGNGHHRSGHHTSR